MGVALHVCTPARELRDTKEIVQTKESSCKRTMYDDDEEDIPQLLELKVHVVG